MSRGLGRLFTRQQPAPEPTVRHVEMPTELRTLSEFATDFSASGGIWWNGPYRGGMSIPAAWRASTLIADLIGQIPWDAYRDRAGRPTECLCPTPRLLADPAPPRTRMEVFSSLALDLLWHGNAIGVIASRNAEGWPTSFVPVPAEWVGIELPPGYSAGQVVPPGAIQYRIGTWVGTPWDVLHFRGPCEPNAIRGMGVLEAHLNGALKTAKEQEQQASNVSQHGVPTGLLKAVSPDVSLGDLRAAKASWLSEQASRSIAALSPSVDFVPLAWNPEQMQMVEARKFTTQQIALMFGLPGRYLGVEAGSLTYSTPNLDSIDLLKFTLAGHLARFEQEFARHLPYGTWVKADPDVITRADLQTRISTYVAGIQAGIYTVPEVRADLRLPPLDEDPAVAEDDMADDELGDGGDELGDEVPEDEGDSL